MPGNTNMVADAISRWAYPASQAARDVTKHGTVEDKEEMTGSLRRKKAKKGSVVSQPEVGGRFGKWTKARRRTKFKASKKSKVSKTGPEVIKVKPKVTKAPRKKHKSSEKTKNTPHLPQLKIRPQVWKFLEGDVLDPPPHQEFQAQNKKQGSSSSTKRIEKKDKNNGKIFTPRRRRGKNQTYWKYLYPRPEEKKMTSSHLRWKWKARKASTWGQWRETREAYL